MGWFSVGLISFLFLWCLFIVVSILTALWMDEFSQFQRRTELGLFSKPQAVWFGICFIHGVSGREEVWKTEFNLGSSFIKKKLNYPIKWKTNDFYEFWKKSVRLFAQAFLACNSFSQLWNLCFLVLPSIRKICHKRGCTHHPDVNASLEPSVQCESVKYEKCGSSYSWFYRHERDGMECNIYNFPGNTYRKQVLEKKIKALPLKSRTLLKLCW